jgi:hypothetical protein
MAMFGTLTNGSSDTSKIAFDCAINKLHAQANNENVALMDNGNADGGLRRNPYGKAEALPDYMLALASYLQAKGAFRSFDANRE